MASITFFILLALTLSSTIHARESQFFAKVSNNNPKDTLPLNRNQQQDLNFIPQSQQDTGNSYGLYGHESGQLAPSTTTTTNNNNIPTITATRLPANLPENYNPVSYTTPIHSSTQELPEEFKDPQPFNYNENGNYGNDENMYNYEKQEVATNGGNMYNPEKQGMSDTRFMENGKYKYVGDNVYNSQNFEDTRFMETDQDGGNMYNNQKQGVNDMYNSEKQGLGEVKYSESNNGNTYNPEKQGMSDTRFLENGKYFYDVAMENANNANMYSRGVRNGYETQGYYGNKENSFERYNTNVGGYQNQGYQENQVNMNQYSP
ncbi:uncharacterized protein [Rutidosis leptorrhynchoides]|uniref:uncharacterized protein n=1 Tax=Rutidosis leptorrhynchoides TaxID=125765 RepID=UPI003A990D08